MTKLMEQLVAEAALLSPDEQDALAIRMRDAIAAISDDAPVPESHKKFLDERTSARDRAPGTSLPYEKVMDRLAARERKSAPQPFGPS